MKRLGLLICAVAMLGVGCDDDGPTAPSNPNQVVFTAALSAANEVPPISNAESTARGNAQITFDLTRDSGGAITGATTTWVFTLSDFPDGSTIRLGHIHEGAAGVAGGVRIDTGLTPATALSVTGGRLGNQIITKAVTPTELPQVQRVIDNPGGFYFNLHSALNGGGVVRGQLTRVR